MCIKFSLRFFFLWYHPTASSRSNLQRRIPPCAIRGIMSRCARGYKRQVKPSVAFARPPVKGKTNAVNLLSPKEKKKEENVKEKKRKQRGNKNYREQRGEKTTVKNQSRPMHDHRDRVFVRQGISSQGIARRASKRRNLTERSNRTGVS